MDTSDQIYAPATSFLGKGTKKSTEQRAGWHPEPAWGCGEGNNLSLLSETKFWFLGC
jgi:hypothetical protein